MPKLSLRQFSFAAISPVIEEVSIFARNIIIARLCGAETLGAYLFALIVLRLGVMSTDLSVERYLITQAGLSENGFKDKVKVAHSVQLIRTLLLMTILCVAAQIPSLLPAGVWPWLLIIIGVQGVMNLGYHAEQTGLHYNNQVIIKALIPLAGVGFLVFLLSQSATLPAAMAGMAVTIGLQMVASHFLSPYRYQVAFCPVMMKKILRFGFPLLGASAVMFWSMQGDRMIIGTLFTVEEFARFSISFQLALVPVLILGKVSLLIGLPMAAGFLQHYNTDNQRQPIEQFLNQTTLAYAGAALVFSAAYYTLANAVSQIVFGPDFYSAPTVILLIGLCQAMRIVRTPASVVAQAAGHTSLPFKANIVRLLGTGVGAILLIDGGTVTTLLWAAFGAEIIAYFYQSTRLKAHLVPKPKAVDHPVAKGILS